MAITCIAISTGATPRSRAKEPTIASSALGRRRTKAQKNRNAAYWQRREEMLRVASLLFSEKGYEATTLTDIADRLEIDRATLYYYIGSKEEVLQDILVGLPSESVTVAEGLLTQDTTAIAKLAVLVQHILESYEGKYPQVFMYLHEGLTRIEQESGKSAKTIVAQNARLNELLCEILQAGIDNGEIRPDIPAALATQLVWGILNWTHRWFKPGSEYDSAYLAQTFINVFIEGMAAKI